MMLRCLFSCKNTTFSQQWERKYVRTLTTGYGFVIVDVGKGVAISVKGWVIPFHRIASGHDEVFELSPCIENTQLFHCQVQVVSRCTLVSILSQKEQKKIHNNDQISTRICLTLSYFFFFTLSHLCSKASWTERRSFGSTQSSCCNKSFAWSLIALHTGAFNY